MAAKLSDLNSVTENANFDPTGVCCYREVFFITFKGNRP